MAKASKASVDYSLGHMKGDHCGICSHFEAPDSCGVVAGKIDPKYWCKRFKAKSKRDRLYGKGK